MSTRYDEVTPEHRARLEYELGVIEKMGYASYFLIVWDFVRFAAENEIPCQARRLRLRLSGRVSLGFKQRLPAQI